MKVWQIAGVFLLSFSACAIAQKTDSGKKQDCGKKKAKDCQTQPASASPAPAQLAPFPEAASQNAPMPGEDANAPSDTPHAATNPNSLPTVPTDGKEPLPPGESPSSSQPPDLTLPQSDDGGISSSRDNDLPGAAAPGPTTQDDDTSVKSAPLKNLGSSDNSEHIREKLNKTRVPDDLKVARFYQNDGNLMGAYLRYKDAVEYDADSEEALWGLAEVADKLNKTDEARKHYNAYLQLDPDADHAKEARAALKRLGADAKSNRAKK